MKKRKLTDSERTAIIGTAKAYVDAQMRTMAKFGSAPDLNADQYEALVLACAEPALEIAVYRAPPPLVERKPLYCGVELVGGWCKRAIGHDGEHACS